MVSTLAIYAGGVPDRLLTSLHGTSLSAVIVFVALIACGLWVLRTASASAWRWAAGIGGVLASAELAGLWLRNLGVAGQSVLQSADFAWNAVHWLGIFWMVTGGLAALISALDAHDLRSGPDGASEPERGPRLAARMVASLRATDRSRRGKTVLAVFGILVVSRVPYLLVYWPGLVFFDTFRSYAYARGTSPWQTYEPVGNSLLVALMQWLGTALGWGDAGGVAIGSITGIVAGSAAFTFMLVRIAVWRVHPGVWAAAFAWAVLLPVFGFLSIEVVKDVPFSIALTVFLVCVGEVSLGGRETAKKLWPWLTMTGAGLFVLVTRNNGIHVLLLSLPVLLVVLRHAWKRMLVVVATLAVGT